MHPLQHTVMWLHLCAHCQLEDVDCICFSTQSGECIHELIVNLQCRSKMPRIVAAWLRCYVMVNVVYFLTGGMWAYYVYVCWGNKFFAPGNMPALTDMGEQIKVRHHNISQHVEFRLPTHLGCAPHVARCASQLCQ